MDLRDEWEARVYGRGKPERAARDLTDEELVNFLAACGEDPMAVQLLKQEALARLHRFPRADRGNVNELAPHKRS